MSDDYLLTKEHAEDVHDYIRNANAFDFDLEGKEHHRDLQRRLILGRLADLAVGTDDVNLFRRHGFTLPPNVQTKEMLAIAVYAMNYSERTLRRKYDLQHVNATTTAAERRLIIARANHHRNRRLDRRYVVGVIGWTISCIYSVHALNKVMTGDRGDYVRTFPAALFVVFMVWMCVLTAVIMSHQRMTRRARYEYYDACEALEREIDGEAAKRKNGQEAP